MESGSAELPPTTARSSLKRVSILGIVSMVWAKYSFFKYLDALVLAEIPTWMQTTVYVPGLSGSIHV